MRLSRKAFSMTALVQTVSGFGFGLNGFFARLGREFEAFFEESGRALYHAHRDYPFGL